MARRQKLLNHPTRSNQSRVCHRSDVRPQMKKHYIIPLVVIAALGGAPFVVPLFNPWSRINCKDQEIDWICYRMRMTRYIYWIPFHGAIENSIISRELSLTQYPVVTPRKAHAHVHQWDTLRTFSQYMKSPLHHVSYAAFHKSRNWDGSGKPINLTRPKGKRRLSNSSQQGMIAKCPLGATHIGPITSED